MHKLVKVVILGRQSLAQVASLAPTAEVVAVVSSAEAAIDAVATNEATILFLDKDLPGASGMERLTRLKTTHPSLAIIVVAKGGDASIMPEATDAGASGFITVDPTPEIIADAIEVVGAGGLYIDHEQTRRMVERLGEISNRGEEAGLTPRENEIIRLLAEGLSARQISKRLTLSERTINTHVANLYRKLGVSNRIEAVRKAISMGLVEPPE